MNGYLEPSPWGAAHTCRTRAAHVVVVVPQRAPRQPHAVHVEPLVATAVALDPVYFFACWGKIFVSVLP